MLWCSIVRNHWALERSSVLFPGHFSWTPVCKCFYGVRLLTAHAANQADRKRGWSFYDVALFIWEELCTIRTGSLALRGAQLWKRWNGEPSRWNIHEHCSYLSCCNSRLKAAEKFLFFVFWTQLQQDAWFNSSVINILFDGVAVHFRMGLFISSCHLVCLFIMKSSICITRSFSTIHVDNLTGKIVMLQMVTSFFMFFSWVFQKH